MEIAHSSFPTGFDDVVASLLSRLGVHLKSVFDLRPSLRKWSAGNSGMGEDGGNKERVL